MPKTKVLVTGVFDLLHGEHRQFLEKAKALGDELLVGVESDARVRQLKGPQRPINSQDQRLASIHQLKIADQVFVLPEKFDQPQDHEQLIASIKPDILAVSSHSPHLAAKRRIVQKYGGRVVVAHQHNPQISTTNILEDQ